MSVVDTADEKLHAEKNVIQKTGIACDQIRQQARRCIKESECVQIKRMKARDCLETADLPFECLQLMNTLAECRRNMIDPRARFRGRRGDV